MPVTVQTASPVDRSVDRQFKIVTVAGQRSTARSTQTSREQITYSRSTVRSTGKHAHGYVHLPEPQSTGAVDWPNLTQTRSTDRSTGSGQKFRYKQNFEEMNIFIKTILNRN